LQQFRGSEVLITVIDIQFLVSAMALLIECFFPAEGKLYAPIEAFP
jgi:ABC-type sulfate transport system permease subunit